MTGETTAGLRTGDSVKDPFIEIWRGIAVALVVYFHYTSRIPADALNAASGPTLPFWSGKVGVLVFFAISGYLITQSLTYSRSLGSFYAKRLSRIWPLFIVAAITVFVVTRIFPPPVVTGVDMPFNRNEIRLIDLFGTIFFLYDLGLHWVDSAFWSILVELKFYVIIGLFAAIWPGRFATRFGLFAVAIGFVQLVVEFAQPPHARIIGGVFNRVLVADYLPFFAIGVLLCAPRESGRSGTLLTIAIMLAFIQAVLAVVSNPYFELQATLHFILAFTGVLALDAALLRNRIFLFLGHYSYAIYLFHQMIGLTIVAAIAPQLGVDAGAAIACVVALLLAIAGSWLVEWRFRDAFYQALRGLFARLGLDAVPVAAPRPVPVAPTDTQTV